MTKFLPLHDVHEKIGATFTTFCNFAMPLKYHTSQLEEHIWTRTKAGLFDVSHMGVLQLVGPDSALLLDWITSRLFSTQTNMTARYGAVLGVDGMIVDDIIAYRINDFEFVIIANASNYLKVFDHFKKWIVHKNFVCSVKIKEKCILSFQGPKTKDALSLCGYEKWLGYLVTRNKVFVDDNVLVATTGYTGEPGFEIVCDTEYAFEIANKLLAIDFVALIGLAARDSLRSEMGFPLCGTDIGLETFFEDADLSGTKHRQDLYIASACGLIKTQQRVGIFVPEIERSLHETALILSLDGQVIMGYATSAIYSPIRRGMVGQCYLPVEIAIPLEANLQIRSKLYKCFICSFSKLKEDLIIAISKIETQDMMITM